MPVEGTLAFAEHLVSNASRLWIEAELDQRQRLQEVFFPEGLVRELGPDLLRRAESLGLDPEESQDVVQDCFADLRRRQPDPAVVVSWLFRVVRWCALDRIRSEARRQSAEARAAEAQNPSAEENPEERLGLREAVAALPSKERRAIQARLIAGSTVAEAGARAGWKPSSAKKLFARARARLKRLI